MTKHFGCGVQIEMKEEQQLQYEGILFKRISRRVVEIEAVLLTRKLPKQDLINRAAVTEALIEILLAENEELRGWFKDQAVLLQKLLLRPLVVDEHEIRKLQSSGLTFGEHKQKICDVLQGVMLQNEIHKRPLNEGRKIGVEVVKANAKLKQNVVRKMNDDLLKRPANENWKIEVRAQHIAEKTGYKFSYVKKLIAKKRITNQA
jgi:hypothetical protein